MSMTKEEKKTGLKNTYNFAKRMAEKPGMFQSVFVSQMEEVKEIWNKNGWALEELISK